MSNTPDQRTFWQRLCEIPRFGFTLSDAGGRIIKSENLSNWIDRDEAMAVMDAAQVEVDALRAENADLYRQLEQMRNERDTNNLFVERYAFIEAYCKVILPNGLQAEDGSDIDKVMRE